MNTYDQLCDKLIGLGAHKAAVVRVSEIPFAPELRDLCASNQCGNYGKNWTCPPLVGDVHTLMEKVKGYAYALVYQTVGKLEDSFDIEGMRRAKETYLAVTDRMTPVVKAAIPSMDFQLAGGGCTICPVCACQTNEPCRHPDRALSSLEAHGIFVSELAKVAGMNYINGANTVTYFGAYFFQEEAQSKGE